MCTWSKYITLFQRSSPLSTILANEFSKEFSKELLDHDNVFIPLVRNPIQHYFPAPERWISSLLTSLATLCPASSGCDSLVSSVREGGNSLEESIWRLEDFKVATVNKHELASLSPSDFSLANCSYCRWELWKFAILYVNRWGATFGSPRKETT